MKKNKVKFEKRETEEKEEKDKTDGQIIPSDTDYLGIGTPGVRLNPFKPGECPELNIFSTITVYGKRRTGKSIFIKWFTQYLKHLIPWAWVFTLTKFNSFYATMMPEKFILPDFSAGNLKQIMKRQEMALDLFIEQATEGDPDPLNPRALIIWDDYMGNDIRFNKMLHRYYYTGRHFATTNIFATQYVTETPPPIRSNTDIAVIFNTDHRGSLERYGEDFAGKMDKKEFWYLLRKATEQKHNFMVIDNNPNTPYENKFFVGKAEELKAEPQYIFGCEEYWFESKKQLESLMSGKMQKKLDKMKELNEYFPDKRREQLEHQNEQAELVAEIDYPEKSKRFMSKLPQIESKGKKGK